MPNTHLDHLEDLIFTSKRKTLSVLREIFMGVRLSVKWDGAPAIVFGTDPRNGKFFVGTKSVFNKVKVKICYTYEDIDEYYKGNVADILRLCLHHLPRVSGIIQADWIGVGGGSVYCPNTVEYRFSTKTGRDIILAPHTYYDEISPNAVGRIGINLASTLGTFFVGPNEAHAQLGSKPTTNWFQFAHRIARCKVPSEKARPHILKHINKFIRAGSLPAPEVIYSTIPDKYKCEINVTTIKVWHMIFQLKQRLLDAIVVNGTVDCYIDGKPACHEGFVTVSNNPVKLVDRLTFSKANFNLSKNWKHEKV